MSEKYFLNPSHLKFLDWEVQQVNGLLQISLDFFRFNGIFIFCIVCFGRLHLEFPFSWKKSQLSSDDLQRDQPEEQKDPSKKDRKGKKNKKKRDRGSKGKGKGKRKGKGRKGSKKKEHEEETLQEEGFLSVTRTAPRYGTFQPTEVPRAKKTPETTILPEGFDQTLMEMPTLTPDSPTEGPTVVSSPLPETKVSEEVVTRWDH